MKNINSKKARKEIGRLINDLAMYSEWTNAKATIGENFRYWWVRKCECIVELQEVYGIPSILYNDSKETLADPDWAEATYTKEV